jgi:prepilin-type processing-associated H-X9-DG protein
MRLIRSIVVAMVVLAAWAPVNAQPLADRIPSDALLYIGWAGAEKLAPAYAESHLKGVLDSSAIPELFSELGPRIVRRIQLEQAMQGDGFAKEALPALLSIGEVMWKKPTALYVGPLDYSGKVPMPKVAILCDAGKDAQAMSDAVNKLVAQIPPNAPVKIRVQIWPGDTLVVSNCEFPARIEENLGQRDQFKNAIKEGRPDAAFTLYFDAEKVLNVASLAINMAGDANTTKTWQRILLTTGVGGLKRLLFTAGFDGKDWGTQAFLEAPQPRIGLLATLLDSEPISDDLLKLAPQSSSWVAATRLDLARILRDVRNSISRFDPNASKDVEEALKEIGQAIGVDIQKDLLAALGDQWLAYNSDQTGRGILGMTIVNPLRDSAALERSLASLEKQANAALAHAAAEAGPTFSFDTTKIDDLTVHYFAIPALAPSWAIKNNTLYIALFPQILAGAADYDPSAGKSILTNDNFLAARKRIGITNNAVSFSYMDLPKLAPRGYQMVLALQRTALGAADMFGMQTPAMALPPLNKIQPHLAPSASASWVDDSGWHYRAVTPFPGAELLGGEQALATTVAPAVVAIVLPALSKSRMQATMVADMSNLRQIGLGAIMYANDNQGSLPPDLGATLKYTNSPTIYLTPTHAQSAVPPFNVKPEELAKWVNDNSDYVYLGKTLGKLATLNTAQTIIAHEKFELAQNGSINLLYADGHVQLLPTQVAKDLIEQQAKAAAK